MLGTGRSSSRSDGFEKHEEHPLETISSRTPVNDDEQHAIAGPGPGPVVHEKVSP